MVMLDSVSKRYHLDGRDVVGLDAVSLTVPAGEFLAVVGPSGSGKSTLLYTVGGLAQPDTGTVMLNGDSLYGLSLAARARVRRETVGFLFQTFNLVPYLTALQNVLVPLYLAGRLPTEQQQRARQLLEDLGLGDRLHHKPAELSVGQQQRVALARALANEPALILADEPTGSLDPEQAEEVLRQLDRLHVNGATIVLVTHDPDVAHRAQRQVRLEAGRMVS